MLLSLAQLDNQHEKIGTERSISKKGGSTDNAACLVVGKILEVVAGDEFHVTFTIEKIPSLIGIFFRKKKSLKKNSTIPFNQFLQFTFLQISLYFMKKAIWRIQVCRVML